MRNTIITLVVAVALGGLIYVVVSQQNTEIVTDADVESATPADKQRLAQNFGYDNIEALFNSLNEAQREELLSDRQAFSKVVSREALRVSFLDAAAASKFADNEKARYLLARQADDFLVKSYINDRLSAAGIPADFPNEQQISQYYENNKALFSLGERLPVWQIFWPVESGSSKQAQAKLLKKAAEVSDLLRKGKLTFEQAAMKYSGHAASKLQGGYMGILLTDDLRPEIKQQLLALKVNTISSPIRGNDSLHIFRTGAVLAAETLPLAQVRGQVIQALKKAYHEQQQASLNKLVSEQFPVKLEAEKIGAWRQKIIDSYKQKAGKESDQVKADEVK